MRTVLFAAWIAAALACPALRAAEKLPGLPPGKLQEVRRAVSGEMERLGIPGLSIAVAVDLRVVWADGFGMADLENEVPARACTVYRLGSISKPITAVAILQLVERGRMDLDAPIQKYVPAFPAKPWTITPRHLLAHTSGVRHYRAPMEINSTRHYEDLVEPLSIFKDEPLLFEPGTRFLYTTYGYNLLGAALESASDMKFVEYLRQNIFEPAKMEKVRDDHIYDIVPHRARGYRRGTEAAIQNCALADNSNKVPGGGMISTPEDLARFAIALNRGVLLKKETVDQLFTPQKTRDGKPTPYGLGFQVVDRGGRRWVGHSGAQQGVSTLMMTLPREGFAIVAMANLEGANLGPLVAQVADVVLAGGLARENRRTSVDPATSLR